LDYWYIPTQTCCTNRFLSSGAGSLVLLLSNLLPLLVSSNRVGDGGRQGKSRSRLRYVHLLSFPFLHSCITILNKSRQPSLHCHEILTVIYHSCDHGTYPFGFPHFLTTSTQTQRTISRVGISCAPNRTPTKPTVEKKIQISGWRARPKPGAYAHPPSPTSPLRGYVMLTTTTEKLARSSSASSRPHKPASSIPRSALGWVPS